MPTARPTGSRLSRLETSRLATCPRIANCEGQPTQSYYVYTTSSTRVHTVNRERNKSGVWCGVQVVVHGIMCAKIHRNAPVSKLIMESGQPADCRLGPYHLTAV
eukprot:scaffold219253_cov23-Prasinocladus_malaysianus.AAC.1